MTSQFNKLTWHLVRMDCAAAGRPAEQVPARAAAGAAPVAAAALPQVRLCFCRIISHRWWAHPSRAASGTDVQWYPIASMQAVWPACGWAERWAAAEQCPADSIVIRLQPEPCAAASGLARPRAGTVLLAQWLDLPCFPGCWCLLVVTEAVANRPCRHACLSYVQQQPQTEC